MSAVLKTPMTLGVFLEWEGQQPAKFEFDGFHPVGMNGVSVEHSTIQANLITEIGLRLRGGPCRVHGSDLKIDAAGSVRYPDAFVVCSLVQPGARIIADPVIVFEILSPSTSYTDRIKKNLEYRRTPSIRRYVILEQNSQAATVFTRDGEDWKAETLLGDVTLALPEVGIALPLAALYDTVSFPLDMEPDKAAD